tara:strand:+ start:2044 stop:2910 length:867 start_codon:yes stop_codon:yes gene_type:complete
MGKYDRTAQDMGNLIALDHLNLTVPDQQLATLFYVEGLGFTRDPYMTVGLNNMWINAGEQQFHLPTRETPQILRGRIGLVVPDIHELITRLIGIKPQLHTSEFEFTLHDTYVDVRDPWGNEFRCHQQGTHLGGRSIGLEYLLFNVPSGTAEGIGAFYESILGADVVFGERRGAKSVTINSAGKRQALIFREFESPQRQYDRHHIAIYIADFSGPHLRLDEMGLITEESNESQYRFDSITDLKTGNKLYDLEHEVRSMLHPMYGRALVNRNPMQSLQSYKQGNDSLHGF